MSDQYEEDKPWHLTQEPDEEPSYDDLVCRIEELEAKLAKAVDALEFYATQDVTYPNVGTVTFHGHDDNGRKARTTLAELKENQ